MQARHADSLKPARRLGLNPLELDTDACPGKAHEGSICITPVENILTLRGSVFHASDKVSSPVCIGVLVVRPSFAAFYAPPPAFLI